MPRQPLPALARRGNGDARENGANDNGHNGRMSATAYQSRREEIRQAYGDMRGQPDAERDKALARLFALSRWRQEDIGRYELEHGVRRSQPWVSQHIRFGKFLAYAEERMAHWPQGALPLTHPFHEAWATLAEGRFRRHWSETDRDDSEDERYAAVLGSLGEPRQPKPRSKRQSEAARVREAEAKAEDLGERMSYYETLDPEHFYRWRDEPEATAQRMVREDREAAQRLMLALQKALAEDASDKAKSARKPRSKR
jgi:hypothetical protein